MMAAVLRCCGGALVDGCKVSTLLIAAPLDNQVMVSVHVEDSLFTDLEGGFVYYVMYHIPVWDNPIKSPPKRASTFTWM
jgi:hypothetical protein